MDARLGLSAGSGPNSWSKSKPGIGRGKDAGGMRKGGACRGEAAGIVRGKDGLVGVQLGLPEQCALGSCQAEHGTAVAF